MLCIVSMTESQGIIPGTSTYSGSIQPAENYTLATKSDSFCQQFARNSEGCLNYSLVNFLNSNVQTIKKGRFKKIRKLV